MPSSPNYQMFSENYTSNSVDIFIGQALDLLVLVS